MTLLSMTVKAAFLVTALAGIGIGGVVTAAIAHHIMTGTKENTDKEKKNSDENHAKRMNTAEEKIISQDKEKSFFMSVISQKDENEELLERDNMALRETLTSQTELLGVKTQDIANKDEELATLVRDVAEKQHSITEKDAVISAIENEASSKDDEIKRLKEALEKANGLNSQLLAEQLPLHGIIANQAAEIENLNIRRDDELEAFSSAIHTLQDQVSDLTGRSLTPRTSSSTSSQSFLNVNTPRTSSLNVNANAWVPRS